MTSTIYHLVEADLSIPLASLDDPRMAEFVDCQDEIDVLARRWDGFIGQPVLPDAGLIYHEPAMLNVSIWDSIENLHRFTYASKHGEMLSRRAEWFVRSDQPTYVLYWIPAGEIPTEREVKRRFDHLCERGATPHAFTFESPFTVDEMLAFAGHDA